MQLYEVTLDDDPPFRQFFGQHENVTAWAVFFALDCRHGRKRLQRHQLDQNCRIVSTKTLDQEGPTRSTEEPFP